MAPFVARPLKLWLCDPEQYKYSQRRRENERRVDLPPEQVLDRRVESVVHVLQVPQVQGEVAEEVQVALVDVPGACLPDHDGEGVVPIPLFGQVPPAGAGSVSQTGAREAATELISGHVVNKQQIVVLCREVPA